MASNSYEFMAFRGFHYFIICPVVFIQILIFCNFVLVCVQIFFIRVMIVEGIYDDNCLCSCDCAVGFEAIVGVAG